MRARLALYLRALLRADRGLWWVYTRPDGREYEYDNEETARYFAERDGGTAHMRRPLWQIASETREGGR